MTDAREAGVVRDLLRDLGEPAVLTEHKGLERYEAGWRYGRGRALAVVRPRTTQEVSRTVAICHRHGTPIVAQGANTGLVGASVPDPSGRQVVVSLERLRQPLVIDPLARAATVGAGVDLATLNAAAAAHGLVFPLDLAANPTVGGFVSTNAGGSRVLKYGDVRRNVLGLEVVVADAAGSVIDGLSSLRKASLGLDCKQLFIGTGGSFGIVTAATLVLHPLPARRAAALVVPVDLASVPALHEHLGRRLGDRLSAFEGMSRGAITAALSHVPGLRDPFAGAAPPPYAILVEASASDEEADTLEARLLEVIEGAFTAGLIADARVGSPDRLWELRHSLSEGLRGEGQVIGFDISLPLGALPAFHQNLAQEVLGRFPAFRCCDFGHWGDGGEHLNFVHAAGDAGSEALGALRDAVYDLVARHHGAFSAEHGIGPHNEVYYERYTPEPQRHVAAVVKAGLDPAGLLGRLRFAPIGQAAAR